MILRFRPIKVWPAEWNREALDRHNSPFTATYRETLDLLDRELHFLGVSEATLQVDASERDCRLDGQLRADARVKHPGVILTIETRMLGTLTYACDRFQKPPYRSNSPVSWQHNLRAIALGLEALRKVERYGIAERGQQYAGYREIGSGIAVGPAPMTFEQAVRFLSDHSDLVFNPDRVDDDEVEIAYRVAAKRLHPDAGGDTAAFQRLQEAKAVIDRHG